MSLSSLLFQLKPLLVSFADSTVPQSLPTQVQCLQQMITLLKAHQDLAEYEVARYYVSPQVAPLLAQLSRSSDPRERQLAASGLRYTGTRKSAAQLLRPLMKDPDGGVQARAHSAVEALDITDVALPDRRYRLSRSDSPRAKGGWNPSGWSFGLPLGIPRWQRKKKVHVLPSGLQKKLKLPELSTVEDVAKWLGASSPKNLRRYMRPGTSTGSPYVQFQIPKASGELRQITAPRAALKKIQRQILDQLLAKMPAHAAAHGFVRGRSVLSNAQPHEGAKIVVKMDLRDFFPTIHFRRVRGLFSYYGYSSDVAHVLASLCTYRMRLADRRVIWPGVLPQGAPTSPALANVLCRRLDSRLTGLSQKMGAVYTRYADDLTFSFNKEPERPQQLGRFLWYVDQVCQQEGFTENAKKRRILRSCNQQRITGVVVNSGLHIPRAARHAFRAVLHNCRKHGLASQAKGRKDFASYLLGFASYVKMVQPELGRKLRAEVRELLAAEAARKPLS